MIFSFQALGLLVIFVIICIYHSKDIKNSKESSVYSGILVTTYIMQLLYISVYVAMRVGSNVIVFSKLYLISICIIYSLIMIYFWWVGLKDKYRSRQSLLDSKITKIKYSLIAINIVSVLLLLIMPINWNLYVIRGIGVNFVYLMQLIYTFFCICILFIYRNDISTKRLVSLLWVLAALMITIVVEYCFKEIPVINSGIIIVTLVMYLILENSLSKEILRLQIERDHAVKNNMERSTFLTNMSHEIRTPLNTIDGFSQVIIDSDDINSIKEDAEDIRIASKNLIDIINGIIDISIIESGKLEIVKENYNVYDMFDNVINITKSRIKDKDIKFVANIDDNIPKVLLGDETRIEQVLLNILNNAIKYTKEGKITLNVEVVNGESICRLKMSVIDTGIGIKKEDLKRIFDGLEDNDGREKDGYSLGLVVSKQLLDLMDGKIDVDSTYGKGSTFTVTIDQKIASNIKEVSRIKKTIVKPFDSKRKRILVVDDNKLNIKVATRLLAPYNVEVKEAFSGQECLDILDKDTNFDLIFMDDLMPKMSGTETLNILKKIERIEGYDIPVVVLTANAISGMKNKYLEAGFDDYLAKPIDKYELHRVLKKFLKDKKN